jgi:branched-chain amino acid transport system substrate-binding protein
MKAPRFSLIAGITLTAVLISACTGGTPPQQTGSAPKTEPTAAKPAAPAPAPAPAAPAAAPAAKPADAAKPATAGAKMPVKVGISAPGSGGGAFHGHEGVKGANLAIDELNAAPDGKYEYTLFGADDECKPDGGRSSVVKLSQVDRVDVILMSNCSGAVLGGMSVLQEDKVPGLVTGATNPKITEDAGVGGNQYIWRMNSQDALFARYHSQYLVESGVKNVAFLSTNNDYGRGVVTAFKVELEKLGAKTVSEQYFEQGANDFRPQLTAISSAKPDAILAPANHPDAIVALRQMKEMGFKTKYHARADVVSLAFLEKAGDQNLGDGVEESTYWDSTLTEDPDFRNKMRAKYNSEPSLNAYVTYWGMKVVAEAVRLSGGGSRDQIQQGLEKLDLKMPMGRVKFDDHHQAQTDVFIMGFVEGQIKLIKRITPSP